MALDLNALRGKVKSQKIPSIGEKPKTLAKVARENKSESKPAAVRFTGGIKLAIGPRKKLNPAGFPEQETSLPTPEETSLEIPLDRKSVVSGKSVDPGGRLIIKK